MNGTSPIPSPSPNPNPAPNSNLNPPPLPPAYQYPRAQPPNPPRPLGEDPAEREPVASIAAAIECILRQPRRVMFQFRQPGAGRLIGVMMLIAVICALVYGVVVGTFSGGVQLWAAPLKIAGGLLVSAVICLPSFYIFACLSGSQARLVEIAGFISGLLLLMTVLLIGFAPVAWLFSESTNSLAWMGALHIAFWLIATGFGLRFVGTSFGQTQARSKSGLYVWAVIFMLVSLQMTTALRPIIGKADTLLPTEKKFFLSHWEQCLER